MPNIIEAQISLTQEYDGRFEALMDQHGYGKKKDPKQITVFDSTNNLAKYTADEKGKLKVRLNDRGASQYDLLPPTVNEPGVAPKDKRISGGNFAGTKEEVVLTETQRAARKEIQDIWASETPRAIKAFEVAQWLEDNGPKSPGGMHPDYPQTRAAYPRLLEEGLD